MSENSKGRELAYICLVDDITPIENADRLELAHIRGWQCVVGKGEFNKGDLAVYFETDAQLPNVEPFSNMEFLAKKHFKIKIQKIRGVLSNGLLVPVSAFGWELDNSRSKPSVITKRYTSGETGERLFERDGLTERLGVTYNEPEDNVRKAPSSDKYKKMAARHHKLFRNPIIKWIYKKKWGKKLLFVFFGKGVDKKTEFPAWVKKTDEDRCLIGDTKVLTDKGNIRIANIVNKNLDVKVLSVDENGVVEYRNIVGRQKIPNNEELRVIRYPYNIIGNKTNSITCTADHKFFTQRGYVEAKDITMEDEIYAPVKAYPEDVMDIVIGMCLGDACFRFENRLTEKGEPSKGARLSFTQGEKQLSYLKEKLRILGFPDKHINVGKSGYADTNVYFATIGIDYGILNMFHQCHNVQGKKIVITPELCKRMTIRTFAFLHMDDGTLRHRDLTSGVPSVTLSTNSYTEDEVRLLSNRLEELGVTNRVQLTNKGYWEIFLRKEETLKFLDLVTPYICESMRYKTTVDKESLPYLLKDTFYQKEDRILPTHIISNEKYIGKRHHTYVYDITVEKNHNFFANRILTHNCENIPWVLQDKEPWIASEKIDGTSSTYTVKRLKKNRYIYYVCSRNVVMATQEYKYDKKAGIWSPVGKGAKKDPEEIYYKADYYNEMSDKYDIPYVLLDLARNYNEEYVTFQGETFGQNVQKRDYNLNHRELRGFNLIFASKGRLGSIEGAAIMKEYDIPWVPIVNDNYILPDTIEELKQYAAGKSVIDGGMREGLVFRSLDGKKSFKCVDDAFVYQYHR